MASFSLCSRGEFLTGPCPRTCACRVQGGRLSAEVCWEAVQTTPLFLMFMGIYSFSPMPNHLIELGMGVLNLLFELDRTVGRFGQLLTWEGNSILALTCFLARHALSHRWWRTLACGGGGTCVLSSLSPKPFTVASAALTELGIMCVSFIVNVKIPLL